MQIKHISEVTGEIYIVCMEHIVRYTKARAEIVGEVWADEWLLVEAGSREEAKQVAHEYDESGLCDHLKTLDAGKWVVTR